jgi:hypothetical protein
MLSRTRKAIVRRQGQSNPEQTLSALKLVQSLIKLPLYGGFVAQYPLNSFFLRQIGAAHLRTQFRCTLQQGTNLLPPPEIIAFIKY